MQQIIASGAGPDAMFVASDTMASGALQALRDSGLRTPSDVAVFGFDGLDHQLVSLPVLSTMIQPIHCLGQEAVRVLLHQIADPESAPVQRFLPTELALRVSCGCPAVEERVAGVAAEGGVPA